MVKILNYGEIEEKAEAALRALLGEVPFLKARIKRITTDDDSQIDFVADLQVSGTPKKLIIKCKSTGEPRFVRDAVLRFDRGRRNDPTAYPVFMAPY